ncbi:hypothetical protein T12_12860, partial [Trichinella patagoniensis]
LPSKLLLLFYSQLVLLPMSQQSQDTNVAADELSQIHLKELVKRPGYGTVGKRGRTDFPNDSAYFFAIKFHWLLL